MAAKKKCDQIIIACRVCGSPLSKDCGHRGTLAQMTRKTAAAYAIRWATAQLTDSKTRAAGEREGD